VNVPPDQHTSAPSDAPEPFSPEYTRYALGLLVVVYIFNFIDRSILSILLESIKEEFQVSDTYLGFLSGIAFAALYTTLGIPIARWSDRGNRSAVISLAVFVWSGMTAVTGLAQNFTHLVLARIGVGVGEAGCSPPAHSLISDYFPLSQRATALAIYSTGIPIGGGIGLLAGGWLNSTFDWRTAFIVVGLPGIVLAVIVKLTLKEPPREGSAQPQQSGKHEMTISQVMSFMNNLKSFRHMAVGAALHAFYAYGASAFIPSFFQRSHGMDTGELGTYLGIISLTAGVTGTFLGGYLGDLLGPRDARWFMWVPALATLAFLPFGLCLYIWPDPYLALILYLPGSILGGMYLGPTFAMTQTLVAPTMRALASAVLLFVINLIGLGLGPQWVGILSDWLEPSYGIESLRYALLSTTIVFAGWSILHYALASRTLRDDLLVKETQGSEPNRFQ